MTKTLSARNMVVLLVIFFGIIIGVNGVFMVEAVKTFRGEDVQEPYLQGIAYNKTLEQRERQAALGWSAAVSAVRDRSGRVELAIIMRDRNGNPLEHLALSSQLRHPVDAARDKLVALAELPSGVYAGSVDGVEPGAWDVEVRLASRDAIPFEAERRVWLP